MVQEDQESKSPSEPEEVLDADGAGEAAEQPAEEVEGVVEAVDELAEAQAKADENWDLYLRAQADMDNQRRRHQQDLSKARKFSVEKLAQELLPVKDSLESALAISTEHEQFKDGPGRQVVEGVELTVNLLVEALGVGGITQVEALGEVFDPEVHQAMTMQVDDKAVPNTVLHVVQEGYLLNERLLRPAMVIVAKAGESEESSDESAEK